MPWEILSSLNWVHGHNRREGRYVAESTAPLVGKEIEVTVTVEISDRDPHFGFAKRPAKLRVAS